MSSTYSKCTCCDSTIHVKTIDDMLESVYQVIDNHPNLSTFFAILNLDKHSIGICQNNTRIFSIAEPFSSKSSQYRAIQETDSCIYLCFNETMEILEIIKIKPGLFREGDVRGWGTQYKHLDSKEKIRLMEKAFINLSSNVEGLQNYIEYRDLEYDQKEVTLKADNDRVKDNKAFGFYPEDISQYPYFQFDIDHRKIPGQLKTIKFLMQESMSVDCPISLWLHQPMINMYPDFGDVYLWFSGGAGDLESLNEFNFTSTDLPERIENWYAFYMVNSNSLSPDWETFNTIGRSIHKDLQEIVKHHYIVTYCKSFEETYGNHSEREKFKPDSTLS